MPLVAAGRAGSLGGPGAGGAGPEARRPRSRAFPAASPPFARLFPRLPPLVRPPLARCSARAGHSTARRVPGPARPCPALPRGAAPPGLPSGHGGHPEPAAVVPAAVRGLPRCQHHQHDHLVPRRPRLLRHPAPTPPRPHVSTVPGIQGPARAAGSAGLGPPARIPGPSLGPSSCGPRALHPYRTSELWPSLCPSSCG